MRQMSLPGSFLIFPQKCLPDFAAEGETSWQEIIGYSWKFKSQQMLRWPSHFYVWKAPMAANTESTSPMVVFHLQALQATRVVFKKNIIQFCKVLLGMMKVHNKNSYPLHFSVWYKMWVHVWRVMLKWDYCTVFVWFCAVDLKELQICVCYWFLRVQVCPEPSFTH